MERERAAADGEVVVGEAPAPAAGGAALPSALLPPATLRLLPHTHTLHTEEEIPHARAVCFEETPLPLTEAGRSTERHRSRRKKNTFATMARALLLASVLLLGTSGARDRLSPPRPIATPGARVSRARKGRERAERGIARRVAVRAPRPPPSLAIDISTPSISPPRPLPPRRCAGWPGQATCVVGTRRTAREWGRKEARGRSARAREAQHSLDCAPPPHPSSLSLSPSLAFSLKKALRGAQLPRAQLRAPRGPQFPGAGANAPSGAHADWTTRARDRESLRGGRRGSLFPGARRRRGPTGWAAQLSLQPSSRRKRSPSPPSPLLSPNPTPP
jgi:hypothetical protein